jgi:hypothetical protein
VGGEFPGELLVVDQADGFQVVQSGSHLILGVPGAAEATGQLGPAPGPVSQQAEGPILRRALPGRGHRLVLSPPVLVRALS